MTKTAELVELVRLRRELPPPALRRALREAAGLSLADIADALGVTPQACGYWETGKRRPSKKHLRAYAALLRALAEAGTEQDGQAA